jgi:hypothetical protein
MQTAAEGSLPDPHPAQADNLPLPRLRPALDPQGPATAIQLSQSFHSVHGNHRCSAARL